MECSVEAGNLRKRRLPLLHDIDDRKVMRLMQWRERHESFQYSADLFVDDHRSIKVGPSVHNTMPGSDDPKACDLAMQPVQRQSRRLRRFRLFVDCRTLRRERLPGAVA